MDEGSQWLIDFFGDVFVTGTDNLDYLVNIIIALVFDQEQVVAVSGDVSFLG
jgi:hypothetical protein